MAQYILTVAGSKRKGIVIDNKEEVAKYGNRIFTVDNLREVLQFFAECSAG